MLRRYTYRLLLRGKSERASRVRPASVRFAEKYPLHIIVPVFNFFIILTDDVVVFRKDILGFRRHKQKDRVDHDDYDTSTSCRRTADEQLLPYLRYR